MAGARWWEATSFALEFGVTLALTLVALTWLGRWLDARWGTAPGLTITGLVVALAMTSVWTYRRLAPLVASSPETKRQAAAQNSRGETSSS
jgi:hypothetical protein